MQVNSAISTLPSMVLQLLKTQRRASIHDAPTSLNTAALLQQATQGSRYVQEHAPVTGNSVKLYADERQAIPSLVEAIQAAQAVVNVSIFSWEASGAGTALANALMERARAGVEVNVQVDGFGSLLAPFGKNRNLLDRMRDAGINVVINSRFGTKRDAVRAVDHRKLVVIDGRTMFTGGMNMSGRYSTWHDALARFDGPIAAQAGAEFLGRWVDLGGKISDRQKAVFAGVDAIAGTQALSSGTAKVRLTTTKPKVQMNAYDSLILRISEAKSRVWIESPWISDERVAKALADAARRNIDVRIAVTGMRGWSAAPALNLVSKSYFVEMHKAGVKIYEQPTMSHAKLSLIDDVATIGSTNLSQRSLIHDYELNAEVIDKDFAAEIAGFIETDLKAANEITSSDIDFLEKSLARMRNLVGFNY